jgi:serine/threonine protein kinase
MGTVYVVDQLSTGARRALKVMHPAFFQDPSLRRRFELEARIGARIESDHVVQVIAAGTDEASGTPWLVMELLRGEELGSALQRDPLLPIFTIRHILAQVCHALGAAHQVGIVHRDIKPSNIFLASALRREVPFTVKLLDFGVAKVVAEAEIASTAAVGTPLWMAPEQAEQGSTITPAADVWALGLLAFQLFAGKLYWRETSSMGSILREVLLSPIVSASVRAADLGSSRLLPVGFDDWFSRCVQRDPSLRFQNARDAWIALAEVLPESDEPISLALPSGTMIAPIEPRIDGPKPPMQTGVHEDPTNWWHQVPAPIDPGAAGSTIPIIPGGGSSSPLPFPRVTSASDPAPHFNIAVTVPMVANVLRSTSKAIGAVLPSSMIESAEAIEHFFAASFECCEEVAASVMSLRGVRLPDAATDVFFAVFMADRDRASGKAPSKLNTQTFLSFAKPLEEHLKAMGTDGRKVVIVVVDSDELGAGVRQQIFQYRKDYDALVVPLHVGELRRAKRDDERRRDGTSRAHALFKDRLADLHTVQDLYASREPTIDRMQFVGREAVLNALVAALTPGNAFVSVYGPPGSGKSSLVNMAQDGLSATRFVPVRCAHTGSRDALAFALEIANALTETDAPPTVDGSGLREALMKSARVAAKAANRRKERLLLVLEDADWLVHRLTDPASPLEQQRSIRELWTTLAELAKLGVLGLVVTSLFGFMLTQRKIGDWENAFAGQVRLIAVGLLDFASTERMVRELGLQMNVQFDAAAMAAVYQLSAGNVDIARQICSRVVFSLRRRGEHHALQTIHVKATAVEQAGHDLANIGATFGESVLPWLDSVDRRVLHVVAEKRPRSIRDIRKRLEGHASGDACAVSLERLRHLGFVDRIDRRERLILPLMEMWVRHNLDLGEVELSAQRARRFRYVAIGLSLSALSVAAYHSWFKSRVLLTDEVESGGCRYQVQFPERASGGAEIKVYVFRQCSTVPPKDAVDLVCEAGNTADLAGSYGGRVKVMPCADDGACMRAQVGVTLTELGGDDFRFSLRIANKKLSDFEIRRDPFVIIGKTLDEAIKAATAIPLLLSVFVAYHEKWLEALRRLSEALLGGKRGGKKKEEEDAQAPTPRG